MVDQPTKSLLEYGIPDTTTGVLSSIIRPPVTAQHFELKPQFIQFISNDSFAGLPHDCLDKLVKAFLVKYFGHEKTARLRNELSTFRLSDDESLYEAWRRFKRLQRQCPHHGIPEWLLIQTFYNGLTHEFRIYIDAASGGSLLTKNPTEAKELIEKMVANDNYHPGGRQNVKKGGKLDVDALTMLASSVQALTSRFDKLQSGTSTSPLEVSRLSTLQDQAKVQKEQCNAVFLRRDEAFPRQVVEKVCSEESRKDKKGKDIQSSKYVAPPAYEEPMPFPQRLSKAVLDRHFGKYCEALKKVHASIPYSDLLVQMPQFANFVKNIKDRHEDKEVAHKKGPTLLYDNLPPKLHDPGSFTIPCTINEKFFDKVLCDLGASVNLMPYSLYENLGLQGLKPSPIYLQMADRTSRLPKGVVEDVLIKVGELIFPIDFVVMDMKVDHKIPIIFGRPFLATSQALIDVPKGQNRCY
ncbi:uncharacterized protein LOC110728875 [Chenopodium quinoa]|uniref:uncharacterized protein LOC110728875 n=1 Tax=Chenopodium quinoa TaxID=63459 RepID=UPI000B790571|nr:uncharacterized protein LOC110728875 [Chenopodium quinoa]